MNGVYFGNAATENVKGWFVGQFIPPEAGLRHQTGVELKWGVHPAGEERPQSWVRYKKSTTLAIVVEGQIRMSFRKGTETGEVLLAQQGDYVIMPPGIDHTWTAVTDCVVMSVRFPSLPDDQLNLS